MECHLMTMLWIDLYPIRLPTQHFQTPKDDTIVDLVPVLEQVMAMSLVKALTQQIQTTSVQILNHLKDK